MRRLVVPLLLAFLLLPAAGRARSLTGTVRWQGQVTVSEPLRVAPDAELVVEPGSRITFAGGSLEVAGRLTAREAEFTGKRWPGILLKGCDAGTVLAGCRIAGARTGLKAIGGAPHLEKLILAGNEVGMELRQKSAAVVRGCRFEDNRKVGLFVKDEARPVVTDNVFRDNGRFGAYIFRASPAKFAGNRFTGNGTGLMIANYGSDPRIAGNRFTDNEIGIRVDRAARPHLNGNVLRGNRTAIRLYRRSDPLIEGNLVTGNETGISVAYSSYPVIRGNDLAGNGLALELEFQSSTWEEQKGSAARAAAAADRGAFGRAPARAVGEEQRRARDLDGTVDARDNWWGQDGSAELRRIGRGGNPSFIHDGRDQPTFEEGGKDYPLDRVRFAPWRAAPATEQP